MVQGRIVKGIGGFYYVEAADMVYTCKARGIFRRNKVTPMTGDWVRVNIGGDGTGFIEEILPRKNFLIRPPVSNIDQLVIVVSVCDPAPNYLIIDKTIAAAEDKQIEPILVVSKTDLQSGGEIEAVYSKAGFRCFSISSVTGDGMELLRPLLQGKVTAFTGNSGVGKSSLLNSIGRNLNLETGEISRKLGRGRHTTRQVELISLGANTYVADTPGFSSIQLERYDIIRKENLQYCFREFRPYLNRCRFTSCSHVCEKGCAVLQAVKDGAVSRSRHESYVAMYQEAKEIKEWDLK